MVTSIQFAALGHRVVKDKYNWFPERILGLSVMRFPAHPHDALGITKSMDYYGVQLELHPV